MAAVGAERDELAVQLAAVGLEALTYVPEELPAGPVVVVTPAEDYLTHDPTENVYGELTANLELYLLVELAGNEQATADLDLELGRVLDVLLGSARWSLDGMSRPGPFHTAGWLAHGLRLSLSTPVTL